MTRRPVLSVALIAVLLAAAVALTLAVKHAARDRLVRDYEQVAAAEEAIATQQQIAHWNARLDLNPAVLHRLQATCQAAVTAYNHDARTAGVAQLNPAAHCR